MRRRREGDTHGRPKKQTTAEVGGRLSRLTDDSRNNICQPGEILSLKWPGNSQAVLLETNDRRLVHLHSTNNRSSFRRRGGTSALRAASSCHSVSWRRDKKSCAH